MNRLLLKSGEEVQNNSSDFEQGSGFKSYYSNQEAVYDETLDDWVVDYADQDGGEAPFYYSCVEDTLIYF